MAGMSTHANKLRKYTAPALEKGLDILELLAAHGAPLTMSQMAGELGRSVGDMYKGAFGPSLIQVALFCGWKREASPWPW